jgi:hypothetical protein
MKQILSLLLPVQIDNIIRGMKLPAYLLILIAVVSTVRSCIHLLAPDGGAGSIAGMDLSAGAEGIVFAFALWGSSQLLFAIVQLAVAFRYRSLVPAMYLMLILETLLRMLVGRIKPVPFAHTPPGAVGNSVILPLAAGMLALSLWSGLKSPGDAEQSG